MEVQTARNLSCVQIAHKLLKYSHRVGANHFFFLRDEKTASCCVNSTKNIWRDFGIDKGGNSIALVMAALDCNFHNAMKWLDAYYSGSNFFSLTRKKEDFTAPEPQANNSLIKKVQPLQNKALIRYVCERNISEDIAKKYLSELYYEKNGKHYFGVCWSNNLGGYEISNQIGKYALGQKSYTVIKKEGSTEFSIFESMFDFLSLICIFGKELRTNVLILNSVSITAEAIQYLRLQSPKKMYLFLDNDKAGDACTGEFLQANLCPTLDKRLLYKGYKDLNDKLRGIEAGLG